MARTRILVVEDSITVRRHLCAVLASDPELHVVGAAADGQQAIDLCLSLRPDVVTMDMVLPIVSGLAATEHIMAHCPTPILVVSSSANRGELFNTYDALAAGAVDVLEKPLGDEPDGTWERRLIGTVKLVARIRVITHPRLRLGAFGRPRTGAGVLPLPVARPTGRPYQVVLIGASTGGPGAVLEVLGSLPSPFPLPILLVMHIGEPFAAGFAEWLDGRSGMRVSYANDGDLLSARAGQVTMAPAEAHMVATGGRLRLTREPPRHSCRPSVDVLFESAAHEYGAGVIAALLTGMGRDGAAGLLEVRRRGGVTIAQDEATSVVYGMPREAMRLGAVDRELPLARIGPTLAALATSKGAE